MEMNLFKLFLWAVYLFLGGQSEQHCLNPGIVGGEAVDVKDYPYYVRVYYHDKLFCGGTIISPKYVLTIYQCTTGNNLYIQAGGSDNKKTDRFEVKKIHLQEFSSYDRRNDVSILELYSAIENVKAIRYAVKSTYKTGDLVTVAGWGCLKVNGVLSTQLQKIELNVLHPKICHYAYNASYTDNKICAADLESEKAACHPGNPVVLNNILMGIVSYGGGCDRAAKPGLYSDIANVSGFIKEVVGEPQEQCAYPCVVGGEPVNIRDYPYYIRIFHQETFSCGGALIGSNYVLTTAHCMISVSSKDLYVRAGNSNHKFQVKTVHQHPKYTNDFRINDISILELINPIELDDVKIVKFAKETTYKTGDLVTVTGWGCLDENGLMADQLQMVKLNILDLTRCQSWHGTSYAGTKICVGYLEEPKGACHSGDPLTFNNTLIGLVSHHGGCSKKIPPGLYSDVAHASSFIKAIIVKSKALEVLNQAEMLQEPIIFFVYFILSLVFNVIHLIMIIKINAYV